jgi:hypothetical protein
MVLVTERPAAADRDEPLIADLGQDQTSLLRCSAGSRCRGHQECATKAMATVAARPFGDGDHPYLAG